MANPNLFVITGPNAAGKSSFIRSRLNEFSRFEVIMTDVYKTRTREVFYSALKEKKNIVFETVFNNIAFKDYIVDAKKAGYETNLIVLFLNSPQQSLNRVATRYLEQNGLNITKGNVGINFNENFKNVAFHHYYFDQADFIYTGNKNRNEKIMTLRGLEIWDYHSNNHQFIQLFAKYAFSNDRLSETAFSIINKNIDFSNI
ncbi:zeta toxin family protein [Pedobacter sp. 22226]|uniref:zeta toxin family protein n=1 Tax=Pedobacter sp. 22226 TaxID=3453894 RepID=UPI003F8455EF